MRFPAVSKTRFAPRLECCEERTVPATFTVTASQGLAGVQAAITPAAAASDGNDTINLGFGTYTAFGAAVNLVIPNSPNLTNLLIQTTGSSSNPSTPVGTGLLAVLKANG